MAAETAKKFEALERQAHTLMSVFTGAGYEAVAPAIIQPADIFLDVIGEDLRARTYVFTDPDGAELCLRPDLTVPTCLLHLSRHGQADVKARYCYNGPAFRFQPRGITAQHPNEFRQAGIELFAEPDREQAETEVVALILEALRKAGLEQFRVRIGDLGLFHALLDALELPERGRQRLRAQFWRPEAFHAELKRLASPQTARIGALPPDIIGQLAGKSSDAVAGFVAQHLETGGIELIGTRTIDEIAEGLLAAVADTKAEPIGKSTADLIDGYLHVTGPAHSVVGRIESLAKQHRVNVGGALEHYSRRLDLFAASGIDVERLEFSAEFGRNFEYYTGLVFEVVTPELGSLSPIAGGGRYDNLLAAVGARAQVPAVGSAIHTERLLAAVDRGAP
jgi:ATP phosphoribosyltransferase regulatory subunit